MGEVCASLLARALDVDLQANSLASRPKELADKEKQLAKKQLQELATVHKRLEELQAARATKVQKVWDFLCQTKTTLVPLGFIALRSLELVQEVSTMLLLLDSIGVNMLKLEEVICDLLEAEGHVLAEKVAEHVLTCFQNRDPIVNLDLVMLGLVVGTKEAASSGIQEAAKAVAAWF
jgi:hypothetical protein